MRKIWVPLSLLLLVLSVCTWQHRESFGQPLHYTITQKEKRYQLKGMLQTREDIDRLKAEFAAYGKILDTRDAAYNALLEPRGSLPLLKKILPLFVTHYHQGSIQYRDGVLHLAGTVEDESYQREMDALLRQASLPVKNDTAIVNPPKISFVLSQKRKKQYVLRGEFSSSAQKSRLLALFDAHKCKIEPVSGEINPDLTDKADILKKLEAFVPFFVSKVREGKMVYTEGKLSVYGKVISKKEIETIEHYLSTLGIETQNAVLPDIKAIRGKKAKRRAKKLVKVLRQQRAKKEQIKQAEKEVSQDIVAMMDAKAGKPTKIASDNTKVRQNLRTLFETEIIEFNTAQTTLTPLGLGTVSKIAVILKAYPDVKIEIAGHTDSDGDDAFNMLLSQGRVNNVKRALMKEGIEKSRIKAVGYGETKPLVPNTSRENKQKNRRVEIIVIGE